MEGRRGLRAGQPAAHPDRDRQDPRIGAAGRVHRRRRLDVLTATGSPRRRHRLDPVHVRHHRPSRTGAASPFGRADAARRRDRQPAHEAGRRDARRRCRTSCRCRCRSGPGSTKCCSRSGSVHPSSSWAVRNGAFADAVRRFGIRSTVLPPAAMTMLVGRPRASKTSHRCSTSAASAHRLSPLQARRFRDRFGIAVLNGYGQTELGGEIVGWTAADTKEFGDDQARLRRPSSRGCQRTHRRRGGVPGADAGDGGAATPTAPTCPTGSPPTAGSAPATSAASTTTASCGSTVGCPT